MTPDKTITIYRAIRGRLDYSENSPTGPRYFFTGVSDYALLEKGILCSNYSPEQYGPRAGEIGQTAKVPGLPVYLDRGNADGLLESGLYRKGKPALIVAELPLSLLFGENRSIRLVANSAGTSGREFELGKGLLLHYLSTGEWPLPFREFYIASVGNNDLGRVVRPYEKLYRPNKLDEEGRIVAQEGFHEVKPSLEINEAKAELNLK